MGRPQMGSRSQRAYGIHTFCLGNLSHKINILYRYCVTTEPMCRPPNEDSTRPILNECVPATVPSEMCEYRSLLACPLQTFPLLAYPPPEHCARTPRIRLRCW